MRFTFTFVAACGFLMAAACVSGQSPVWVHHYDDPDSYDDAGYAITRGDDGSIYVAGLNNSSTTSYDFFVMSLFAQGDTNWTFATSGGHWWELAEDIVYGSDGNIYAAGSIGDGIVVASLTGAGDSNWTYRLTGSAGGIVQMRLCTVRIAASMLRAG